MNSFLKFFNTIIALFLAAILGVQSLVRLPMVNPVLSETDTYKVYSLGYSQVNADNSKGILMRAWRDGFVTGNGENGCVTAGSPYDDTIIYQNINFVMPRETIRQSEDISGNLDSVRQTLVSGEECYTDHDWYSMYTFHPAGQLRLSQHKHISSSYIRWCDYETGEACVRYRDINGTWSRKTFTSRTDNVTITEIGESSSGSKVNLTLSFDDISLMNNFGDNAEAGLEYKKLVAADASSMALVAHYPVFEGSELNNAGFATVTYIVTIGGTKQRILQRDSGESINVAGDKKPAVKISDASRVFLITVSDRDMNMGTFEQFPAQADYPLVDSLTERCAAVAGKYTAGGEFSYSAALKGSAAEQSALFNAVKIDLGSNITESYSNEALLEYAQKQNKLTGTMVERIYNAGRYAMICCSGSDSISRLYGMWTGEWGARWNGAYTMDANVNLQCSGMNSANCYSYAVSYINFVLRQLEDWKINALHDYGFTNAIQVPCNFDGNSAVSVEYNSTYAFQYWNCGADWMIIPIYEFWQCFGDASIETAQGTKQLLNDILIPLLELHANFWRQMLTPEYYTDASGNIHYEQGKATLAENEYYCILPGYSPENTPLGRSSAVTANVACDIAAAKSGFEMLINAKRAAGDNDTAELNEYIDKLPPYLFDDSGALKEWACNLYQENNGHRHISHLYCAWPYNETQSNANLASACLKAIANRNSAGNAGEETQTHGWLHKGLVAARLKDSAQVTTSLLTLLTNNVYYTSLLTDHNTNRSSDCYCTDTALGIIGVIDEMLLYSDTGKIEILPALASGLDSGSISGLMAKTRAKVDIKWSNGTAEATITSYVDQSISVSCMGSNEQNVSFAANETKTVKFSY